MLNLVPKLLVLAALGLPCAALAQVQLERPPALEDTATIAARWIEGRFRMPVTCLKKDGTRLELEEAVVIRPSRTDEVSVLRATFFGIDAPDIERCYNTAMQEIPDRRGTLYLKRRGMSREDLGLTDFRRDVRDGEVSFAIERGTLSVRDLADPNAVRQRIEFKPGKHDLVTRQILSGSDGAKLLEDWYVEGRKQGLRLRRIKFSIDEVDAFQFNAYYIEDPKRRKQ